MISRAETHPVLVVRLLALFAAAAVVVAGCGKSGDSDKAAPPADFTSSCPEQPATQITVSSPEFATPFSKPHQRPGRAKEWSDDDWRALLECPEGTTVSKEPNGPTLIGSCLDAEGKAQGWKAEVNPFGAPMQVEQWQDGKLHGLSVYYQPDMYSATVGPPMVVTHYREGAAHGPHYLFVEGALRMQGAYEEGARSGCAYEWHATGKLSARGAFSRGERDGVWETWNPDGTPRARARFAAGTIDELERFEDGKWQAANGPDKDYCDQVARRKLGDLAEGDGELHHSVIAELTDYRDDCQLHMTKPDAE